MSREVSRQMNSPMNANLTRPRMPADTAMEFPMTDRQQATGTTRRVVAATALSAMLFMQNAAAFTISNNPPFLPTPLSPNIALTLDDSGSMAWAYVPDGLQTSNGTRRFKASVFNPLYYNPDTVYPPPVDATGTALTTSFTTAPINGFANDTSGPASRGSVNLSTGYRPTQEYNPSSTNQTFAPHANIATDLLLLQAELLLRGVITVTFGTTTAGPAYYYRYNTLGIGCDGTNTDDDCYELVIVSATSGQNAAIGADERQNFANWYSFYRTRNLMTVSAASRAMSGTPVNTRVAWQSLNTCSSYGTNCQGWTNAGGVSNRIRRWIGTPGDAADATHRNNFYYWLFRLPANNGTPLRTAAGRAGAYFTTSGNNSPYGIDPNQATTVSGTEFSCRPNFHILMTDGIWNSDNNNGGYCSGSSCGEVDGTGRTLPDGKVYSNTATETSIYRGSSSNNVSDIAFHYWATDLRSDLTNNLIPYRADRNGTVDQQYWNPKNDPANWQHLVTFTVGLGLSRWLDVASPTDIRWGGDTYTGAGYSNLLSGAGTWPATGTDVAPGNVYDLWHAAINSRGQSFAADNPGDLSTALQTAMNRILERESAAAALATSSTRLSTGTTLFQARFNSADWTGKLTAFQMNTDASLGNAVWEATDAGKIPDAASRNIYTYSGTAGILFNQTDLTAANLWTSIGSANMLAYLRGDGANEQRNGGTYRNRSLPLGDIINSDPAYVSNENYGYSALPEGRATSATPYATFLTTKNSRRKMLYVGANDGMLHAFDAANGEERFAYVPKTVIPNLSLLSSPTYAHRFYVDGSPTVWDAHNGSAWKSVLIGMTGAGARSLFALDVTNPDAFDASKVMWEINHTTPNQVGDAADPLYGQYLGYTLGGAVVAKMNNGEWAAIFGNGYRSTSEKGSLYIVRVSDGRLIRRIDTLVGSAAAPNGLGTPTLYDSNNDDVADIAYATDMRGNVWKFDLSSTTTSSWAVAYNNAGVPAPLFTARNASNQVQPLQAKVELAHPPSGQTGLIVVVGTGRFFATGDNTDTTGQSFYGILDNGTRVSTTNRSQLVAQTISVTNMSFRGVATNVRQVSTNSVDWTTKRGWYIDLPGSGERVIGPASVLAGRVIFTTLIPSNDPCNFGGSGWLMELSATTGAQLPYSVFDTNGDGLIDTNDSVLGGVPVTVGMVKQPVVLDGAPAAKVMSGTSGSTQSERNRTFQQTGRDSWRETTR